MRSPGQWSQDLEGTGQVVLQEQPLTKTAGTAWPHWNWSHQLHSDQPRTACPGPSVPKIQSGHPSWHWRTHAGPESRHCCSPAGCETGIAENLSRAVWPASFRHKSQSCHYLAALATNPPPQVQDLLFATPAEGRHKLVCKGAPGTTDLFTSTTPTPCSLIFIF